MLLFINAVSSHFWIFEQNIKSGHTQMKFIERIFSDLYKMVLKPKSAIVWEKGSEEHFYAVLSVVRWYFPSESLDIFRSFEKSFLDIS